MEERRRGGRKYMTGRNRVSGSYRRRKEGKGLEGQDIIGGIRR